MCLYMPADCDTVKILPVILSIPFAHTTMFFQTRITTKFLSSVIHSTGPSTGSGNRCNALLQPKASAPFDRPLRQAPSTGPFDKLRELREHRELKGLAELDKLNMFCGKNVHKGKKVKKRLRVKFELLVYMLYCMHTLY